MKEKLKKLGFKKNRVIETVFLTKGKEKTNHAPIGVKRKKGKKLEAKVYKETNTYHNLKENRFFSINLINDYNIFYDSIFDKELEIQNLELKNSFRTIKGKSIEIEEKKEFGLFTLKPHKIQERKTPSPKGYCRAESAIIEALIYHTKIPHIDEEKALEKIKDKKEIVKKTGSLKEKELINKLIEKTKTKKKKH